jgi:hypothetical protein
MRTICLPEERARGEFAERAAHHFAENPRHWSYSESMQDVQPGELLALRWGLHNRAVLVLKVADEVPVIYMDLVPMTATELESTALRPAPRATLDGTTFFDSPRGPIDAEGVMRILSIADIKIDRVSTQARLAEYFNRYFTTGALPV